MVHATDTLFEYTTVAMGEKSQSIYFYNQTPMIRIEFEEKKNTRKFFL